MASTNSMSQFLASIKEGGTFVVPPCVVSSLELNPLGYQCYGDSNVVHRVSDPVCLLPSLGEPKGVTHHHTICQNKVTIPNLTFES